MKGKRVTKTNKKGSMNQRPVELELMPTTVVEDFGSDFIEADFLSGITNEATERKRASKKRVVASGFKPMTLNLDSGLMELLQNFYGGAGLKYTERGGERCFKTAELSAMISYLITSYCDDVAVNGELGFKVYLHKILTVVKFRKESQCENAEQICGFLNANKFKRYASGSSIKNGSGSLWEPKHLKIYLDADTVDELYKVMNARPKRKKIFREIKS